MQRSYEEMMDLILHKAREDERIRAVTMEGSRANDNAVHDQYSDFDICYYVTDIRQFTGDPHWIEYFGEILIVQCPADWYNEPYDYNSHDRFNYLIQFADGNRIDLSLIDVRNIEEERQNDEPRMILMDKDGYEALIPLASEAAFYIGRPSAKEYADICNEFRWVILYVTKGLCRREIYYAKHNYDVNVVPMFLKMINWRVAMEHEFQMTTGKCGKYLKRFLTPAEMERFQSIFPNGQYEDIWEKLFIIYDYFAELAAQVAERLGFCFDADETRRVRQFMEQRLNEYKEELANEC